LNAINEAPSLQKRYRVKQKLESEHLKNQTLVDGFKKPSLKMKLYDLGFKRVSWKKSVAGLNSSHELGF
jgi:hypothetical protein